MNSLSVVSVQAVLSTCAIILLSNIGVAQVMTSSNYQIESDSVNTGGGSASSASYQLEMTVGEQATGESSSASYTTRAGFQQMQGSYISLIPGDPVAMSPSIPGVAGGTATGSTTVTVITDSLAGYELTIESATSPAMKSGSNSIADYVPIGAAADYNFTTGSADAHFGYSPEGVDIVARFLNTGSACGSGTDTPDRCWDGVSTTAQVIAQSATANHPAGTETVIKFQVGVGGSVVQAPGIYVATTTLTAIPL